MRTRSRTAGTTTYRVPGGRRAHSLGDFRGARGVPGGNPLIYGCCGIPGAVCEFEETCDKPENERTCKPEGLAVELCDAIMRILDYLAYMHVDVEAVLEAKHAYNLGRPYRHGGKKA